MNSLLTIVIWDWLKAITWYLPTCTMWINKLITDHNQKQAVHEWETHSWGRFFFFLGFFFLPFFHWTVLWIQKWCIVIQAHTHIFCVQRFEIGFSYGLAGFASSHYSYKFIWRWSFCWQLILSYISALSIIILLLLYYVWMNENVYSAMYALLLFPLYFFQSRMGI